MVLKWVIWLVVRLVVVIRLVLANLSVRVWWLLVTRVWCINFRSLSVDMRWSIAEALRRTTLVRL